MTQGENPTPRVEKLFYSRDTLRTPALVSYIT